MLRLLKCNTFHKHVLPNVTCKIEAYMKEKADQKSAAMSFTHTKFRMLRGGRAIFIP